MGGDFRREQGLSTRALRGLADASGRFREPRAGSPRDATVALRREACQGAREPRRPSGDRPWGATGRRGAILSAILATIAFVPRRPLSASALRSSRIVISQRGVSAFWRMWITFGKRASVASETPSASEMLPQSSLVSEPARPYRRLSPRRSHAPREAARAAEPATLRHRPAYGSFPVAARPDR